MNVHDATEQAYKNGYAKGYAEGVNQSLRRMRIEILDAIKSNFQAKEERIVKCNNHNIPIDEENSFLQYLNGKITALRGIDDFADNLVEEMVGADNG